MLPSASFLCGRIYLHCSEESEAEEISPVWNDSLSTAVGNVLMLVLGF